MIFEYLKSHVEHPFTRTAFEAMDRGQPCPENLPADLPEAERDLLTSFQTEDGKVILDRAHKVMAMIAQTDRAVITQILDSVLDAELPIHEVKKQLRTFVATTSHVEYRMLAMCLIDLADGRPWSEELFGNLSEPSKIALTSLHAMSEDRLEEALASVCKLFEMV